MSSHPATNTVSGEVWTDRAPNYRVFAHLFGKPVAIGVFHLRRGRW
jgi:hypothetical protein